MNQTSKLTRLYDVQLTLLSPLHIGTGRELQREYDYVTHGDKTWVINADSMLDAFVKPDGTFDSRIIGRPASELLKVEDYRVDSPSFRYVLEGRPRALGEGAVLREQIKDVFDRPYIPGSSLKGALRTVLAWHAYQERKAGLKVESLSNKSWAAQPTERTLFGRDPNHDLLRAIRVADSVALPANTLRICNAQVVTGSEKMGSPIELEAVKTDTTFRTTLSIDEFLRLPMAEAELGFGDRWQWIDNLPAIARAWATQLLTQERKWYQERHYDRVAGLYGQMLDLLANNKLGSRRFFLQIGWGGGWNVKTIGIPLKKDAAAFEQLLGHNRLSPARFRRRANDPFPKSRRVMVVNGQPVAPFGWCLVEMKERG
jgi:CRISPR-associated protein Csm5